MESTSASLNEAQKRCVSVTMVLVDQALRASSLMSGPFWRNVARIVCGAMDQSLNPFSPTSTPCWCDSSHGFG